MEKLKSYTNRTFASLKVRNYRLFFIAQIISFTGNWMQMVAQAWLVLTLTNSGTALGAVVALQFLPLLIIGPWSGSVADRFSRRRILVITNVLAGLLALALGVLVSTSLITLLQLYGFALAIGILTAFDTSARKVFVMELVGGKTLKNAILLNGILLNGSRVIGPTIAAILIAKIGLAASFFVNAVTFVAPLVALALMRGNELFTFAYASNSKGQVRAAFSYIRSQPVIRSTLIMIAIIGTLTFEAQVTYPLFAKFSLGGDASTFAALMAVMSLGAVVGGLWAAGRNNDINFQHIIYTALAVGVTTLLMAIAPSLGTALICTFGIGVSMILYTAYSQTSLQLLAKPEMRGRVLSLWTAGLLGSTPIGGLFIGYISQQTSARWGLAVGGIAAISVAIFYLINSHSSATQLKKI